jgi:hypothetical protein
LSVAATEIVMRATVGGAHSRRWRHNRADGGDSGTDIYFANNFSIYVLLNKI